MIEKYPKFPFAHYALAYCLEKKGDEAWRTHGQKAIAILRYTTTVDGHHPNHDTTLTLLEASLVPGLGGKPPVSSPN